MSSSVCLFTCSLRDFICPLTLPRLQFMLGLHFTLSLQSSFYTQSAFYPWSAVSLRSWRYCVVVGWDLAAKRSRAAKPRSTASSLLPFFGTRLRRQNFNLAPTQYRQLRRLSAVCVLHWPNKNHNFKTKLVRFVLFDTINICKRRSGPPNKLSDHITQDSHLNINLTTALQAAFPGTSYSAQSSVCSLKITNFITLL